MLCIRTQALLDLDKNKESLNFHGHFEAVSWPVVMLPFPVEVRVSESKAIYSLVKEREGREGWEESPEQVQPVGSQ